MLDNNAKDGFGIAKPLTKLFECVSAGIGKVYEPVHIRRMANAKAYEMKVIADAINENPTLLTTYRGGKIGGSNEHLHEFVLRTQERFLFQEIQKQLNTEAIIASAYSELEKEDAVSDEPVDKDWILRFFNSVGDISDEEMQAIWGKILAGEIKQPNSFAKRTLDVVKNLSTEEAQLFTRLCTGAIGDALVADMDGRPIFGTYIEVIKLQEAGLLSSQISRNTYEFNYREQNEKKQIRMPLIGSAHVVIIDSEKISVQCYLLTSVGRVLMQFSQSQLDLSDVIKVAEQLAKISNDAHVSVCQIIEKIKNSDGRFVCRGNGPPLWENKKSESVADNG